jgi:uncharacterized protein (DUF58 family)
VVQQTGSGGITVLLAGVLGLISLRASNPWLLLVGCALLAPVVISQLLRPDLQSISICFNSPDRVAVGDSIEQIFHAHNRGRRSSPDLRLIHSLHGFAPLTIAVPALPPGGRADLRVLRPAVVRGVSIVHDVRLQTTSPFGMALHHRRIPVIARISVHPAPGPVAVLPGAASGQLVGGRPTRAGHDPHELREWHRGDSLRQVHWRATARHDRLTVVIPEVTIHARFSLVVAGSSLDDEWETLLGTAAWTAVEAARSGGTVLLSAEGTPEYHGDDPGAVLDWFAGLGPVERPGPAVLLAAGEWAGTGGSVIIATTRPAAEAGLSGLAGIVLLTPDGQVRG